MGDHMTMTKLERSSGILLHPTSFPGPDGIGDLGPEALPPVRLMEDFSAQERQTHDFATQTTTTVRAVCPDAPGYVAKAIIHKGIWKATIASPGDQPVTMTVDRRKLLRLKVS